MAQRSPRRHAIPLAPAVPQRHTCVAFLPLGPKLFKTKALLPYKENPATLGEHIKKARLTRGLSQRKVADILNISQFTYIWWERDRYLPNIKVWKAIVEFLGYYPIIEPISELNWKLAIRRQHGLSKSYIANLLNIDEATYAKIEDNQIVHGKYVSYEDIVTKLKNLQLKLLN